MRYSGIKGFTVDVFNKMLLIMRHGKAKGGEAGGRDFDRRLRKRGIRDAARMGEVFLEKGCVPDLIVTSTAARAVMTADAVAEGCGYSGKILRMESLYLGTAEQYLRVLEGLGYEGEARHGGAEGVDGAVGGGCYDRILMIGHQPVLSYLVYGITGQSVDMTTGSVAVIGLGIDSWAEVNNGGGGCGSLVEVYRPCDD